MCRDSPLSNDDDHLYIYLFVISISSLKKWFIELFGPILIWIVCFLSIEFWASFFCSGYKFFTGCLLCKYFLPVYLKLHIPFLSSLSSHTLLSLPVTPRSPHFTCQIANLYWSFPECLGQVFYPGFLSRVGCSRIATEVMQLVSGIIGIQTLKSWCWSPGF